ncbi:energy-coupling factor transporter ATPase [Paenibacillus marinisediminis]
MIQLERVSFRYPKREALFQDLSLHIPRGQWVSIVGPNGSGKSTLIKLINGLLVPEAGTITVADMVLSRDTIEQVRHRVGYLFQNPDNQFIATTVRDDMAYGMENRCVPREQMEERIEQVASELGLTEWMNRHPASLSGGQKQRVAIAGLLVLNPDIMIWDEATSMLDERAKRDMIAKLKELHRDLGMTIISVTHDAEEILESERVVVVKDGAIAADMLPLELFEHKQLAEECKLRPPFTLAISLEMRSRGIDIEMYQDEGELVKALWPSCTGRI